MNARKSLPSPFGFMAIGAVILACLLPVTVAAGEKEVIVVNTPGVNVLNLPDLHIANTPDVNVVNTPGVNVMNVPGVQVLGTPNVHLSDTAAVEVINTPAVTASIVGQPTVGLAEGSSVVVSGVVEVSNLTDSAVPVRIEDQQGPITIHGYASGTLLSGDTIIGGDYRFPGEDIVPVGYRLVVDMITFETSGPAGQILLVNGVSNVQGVSYSIPIELTHYVSDSWSQGKASQVVQYFVDGGFPARYNFRRFGPSQGDASVITNLFGHLVKMPE